MNKFLKALGKAICACKGHAYDFKNVEEKHYVGHGITVFVLRCTRCRCNTGIAVKDSDLRVTYPLELSFERSVADVPGKTQNYGTKIYSLCCGRFEVLDLGR